MTFTFTETFLSGTLAVNAPTALQWGPDGKLYIASRTGQIDIVTVQKSGDGSYAISGQTVLSLINTIPNHDDDGGYNAAIGTRLVTGLTVTGTAGNPIIYVSSSDPRSGGGTSGTDTGLDTNSGTISRLTWVNGQWEKVDIVRGLPRSEGDHATNGLALSADGTHLLVAQGGNTNAGAPSHNLGGLMDYALSGAILTIDLNMIAQIENAGVKSYSPAPGLTQNYVYDLPTLNDPTRPDDMTGADLPGHGTVGSDPFGGHDGLNMARLVEGGPVQVMMPGFRNPYDVLVTQDGRVWSYDNGPSSTQGGIPLDQNGQQYTGAPGQIAVNLANENGFATVNNTDQLHEILPGGYAGNPNLIRAFGAAAGLLQSPGAGVTGASLLTGGSLPADFNNVVSPNLLNPQEALYREGGIADGSVDSGTGSTNGLAEYTSAIRVSDSAGGTHVLQGALLATNFQLGQLIVIDRYADGDGDVETMADAAGKTIAQNRQVISIGGRPLGIDAVGDDGLFPGTIWVTMLSGNTIAILEPPAGSLSADDRPVITSHGGGASAVISIAENSKAVTSVIATDRDDQDLDFSISGEDSALFRIDEHSGVLTFASAPNFERPADTGQDNVYHVTVIASDDSSFASQALTIHITNVVETQRLNLTDSSDTFVAPSADNWTINGKLGNDSITTGDGNDIITGGKGNDIMSSGGGDDLFLFSGPSGADTIDGGSGWDAIRATQQNATLNWGHYSGIEEMSAGGFANVRILGSAAANVMDFSAIALTGIAKIFGGGGADTLTGSAQTDVFAYARKGDSSSGSGADTIFQFQDGMDRIDLSAVDANSKVSGLQHFTLIGTAAFDRVAGQLRVDTMMPGKTMIYGDTDGNGVADFTIILDGVHTLDSATFIL